MTDAQCEMLVVGRVYCDLVFAGLPRLPAPGREEYARDLVVTAGGGAFITAAHLHALGKAVGLVGRIGTDPFSAAIESELERTGLDRRWIEKTDVPAPQVTVAMPLDGDRAFLTHLSGEGRLAGIEDAIAESGARHLHIAELATLAAMPGLPGMARDAGMSVSLDCSWDADVICDADARALIGAVDVFLPNASEACSLADLPHGEDQTALARLGDLVPVVAVKQGAAGARAMDANGEVAVKAPSVDAVDTTGAGDAFNAGFLCRYLDGADLPTCLRWAVACGSLAVQSIGGAVVPVNAADARHLADGLSVR